MNFLDRFFASCSSNSMKICPEGADLFHADGETEVTALIVAYRNFAKEPKIDLEMIEQSK
jgi:hypothetical protein